MSRLLRSVLVLIPVLLLSVSATARPPWRVRKRPESQLNRLAAVIVTPEEWPQEPPSPPEVDVERFADGLRRLCGFMPQDRARRYANIMIEVGNEFDVDPFLLAGLMYRQSHCRADREELSGVGLTLIVPELFRSQFRRRAFHYFVLTEGGYEERVLPLPRFPFNALKLRNAEANLYFAAAMLAVLREQEAAIHAAYPQMPHRHYLSHFIWGDRVKSDRAEDRILTDRRRMLEYYGAWPSPDPLPRLGLSLHSPLDGAPRVCSSGLGDVRDGGQRSHRGIDIEAEFGEPVRAVADGSVVFVGVDLPGRHRNESMRRSEVNGYPLRAMGRGGRYVCLSHRPDQGTEVRSCYMHLSSVEVDVGAVVSGGELIGTVGRTGMKRSAPHLHFEMRTMDSLLDPLEHLRGHVIGSPADPEGPEVRAFRKASQVLYQPH